MSKTADFKTPEEALEFWQQKITELTTGEGKDIQVSSFTAHLALTGLYQAMHTYGEKMAVGFGLWLLGNCDQSAICWYYDGEQKTTADLYQLYLNQHNQK